MSARQHANGRLLISRTRQAGGEEMIPHATAYENHVARVRLQSAIEREVTQGGRINRRAMRADIAREIEAAMDSQTRRTNAAYGLHP